MSSRPPSIAEVPEQNGTITYSQTYEFVGPLPPPELLADFDRVSPGSADKIIDQFVKQGEHRMAMEQKALGSDVERSRWGLVGGIIVSVVAFGVSVVFVYHGYPTQGALITGGTLGSLVGVFLYGTERRRTERKEKTKALAKQ